MSDDEVIFAERTLQEIVSAVSDFRKMFRESVDGRRWLAANRARVERELDDLRLILSCAGDDHLPIGQAEPTPATYQRLQAAE